MKQYNYKIGNNIKARDEKICIYEMKVCVGYKAICNNNNNFQKKIQPFKLLL